MAEELALFDLPAPQAPARVLRAGWARETYARTVIADVGVRRGAVLRAAALRSFDESPMVVIGEVDADGDVPDSREKIAADWVAALGWLLDPAADLLPLMEADALRLLAVEIDVRDRTVDRCRLAWTVAVKLRKVAALRDLAMAMCPDGDTHARAEIGESLATAWQWAAEPYAPLRGIQGITWTPVQVSVQHRPARP
jgi:hypothetical protein